MIVPPWAEWACLPGEVWKVLILPLSLSLEVKGKGGLRKGHGGDGSLEHAFAALEPSLNFSKREENTTWAGFTLIDATENSLLHLLGLPRRALQGTWKVLRALPLLFSPAPSGMQRSMGPGQPRLVR